MPQRCKGGKAQDPLWPETSKLQAPWARNMMSRAAWRQAINSSPQVVAETHCIATDTRLVEEYARPGVLPPEGASKVNPTWESYSSHLGELSSLGTRPQGTHYRPPKLSARTSQGSLAPTRVAVPITTNVSNPTTQEYHTSRVRCHDTPRYRWYLDLQNSTSETCLTHQERRHIPESWWYSHRYLGPTTKPRQNHFQNYSTFFSKSFRNHFHATR